MWISNFAIKNPVVTSVLMMALGAGGVLALASLDTDEFPDVNPPVITVSVPYPGASPEGVEREVIDPLEESFASITGVRDIQSTAYDSFAVLIVIFEFEKDIQQASQDIRDAISEIRQDLPPEIEEPLLRRFDLNALPIMSLVLSSSKRSASELTRLADPGITKVIRSVPGVADVTVVGGAERELVVELDPRALQAAGMGIGQVVEALRAQNLAAPVGRVQDDLRERTIRLRGRFGSTAEFEQLVVSPSGPRVVRLGELARVLDGSEEPRSAALYNSDRAVGIDVIQTESVSTSAVSAHIREHLAEVRASLPRDVELRVVRDAGPRVEQSVGDVESSLLEGAILTVLVVFLFLNSWRSTVITGLALPVSVLSAFIAVWAMGFTLNTMSLLGLSLAIGILIDDAIVVRENIVRHMEMGKTSMAAAREGTSEIGLAVAATTFSIVVVFVPIAFMGGVAEQWFAPFALTIASSVLVSLFVSFSLDPMLSAYWPDPQVARDRASWPTRRLARLNAWLDRRTSDYRRVIAWALRHRIAVGLIAVGTFVAALAMPAVGLIGVEFFPVQDRSEFIVHIETPPGSSLEYTIQKTQEASRLARERREVAYTYATIGGQGGVAVDEADIYVRLRPRNERDLRQERIATALRDRIRRVGGLTASLATGGFGQQKQIQIRVTGPDVRVLNELASRIADEVERVPGAVDVGLSSKGQRPELEVELDRQLAGSLGVTAAQVALALRPAFAGLDAGDWIDPDGETRDVTVRLAPEARANPADLEGLPLVVPGPRGESVTIPLGQVARVRAGLGPAQIDHFDGRRVVIVGANTEDRALNLVIEDIDARVARLDLPAGYAVEQGGETEDQQEVFGRVLTALGVALALMYLVLVIQFRSFLDPVPIMASLPLSLIGVMLALVSTGSTLNIMSLIGVILLMGIVAKNAILLIDFAKWSEQRGVDRRTAIIEAGGVRLRPILMTSVAIIAGMIPVALGLGEGADFRAPLGRAVIGGVITSTLLTLLVIPTFYDVLAGARERALRRLRRVFRPERSSDAPGRDTPPPVA